MSRAPYFLQSLDDVGERRDIPFHAVDAVHDHEFAAVPAFLEDVFKASHIVVLELFDLGIG